jgi:hypothetical protein
MSRSEHRRQQKLKVRKDKRKVAARNRLGRLALTGDRARMELAVDHGWPVVHARVGTTIWTEGIGMAVMARRGPQGTHVVSVFLIDAWCLGVKEAFVWVGEEAAAREKLREVWQRDPEASDQSPAYIRKLVEEAIGYSLELGLAPHPGCLLAQMIFGDIDPDECEDEFEFGKEGQPFFVAGPYDSEAHRRHIVDTLHKSCGPDGFHFVLPVGPACLEEIGLAGDGNDPPDDNRRLREQGGAFPMIVDRRFPG